MIPIALQFKKELEWIVEFARGKKTILEIGLGAGGTLYQILQVADPEALVISLDMDQLPDAETMLSWAKPGQNLQLIKSDSHTSWVVDFITKHILNGRKIDLLVIDGDHSYEGVKTDYMNYSTLTEGLVLFHDIRGYSEGECEVERFWNELEGNKIEILTHENQTEAGLGVLIHGVTNNFHLQEKQ